METGITSQQLYDIVYRVSHDYFSDVLTIQLATFSLIVAVIVGIQFFASKKKIEDEVKKEVKKAEGKLLEEYKNRVDALVKIASNSEKKLTDKSIALQADIYRTMGHFFDSEKQFSVSFIWWIRAAEKYSLVGEEILVRSVLKWAKESVEKIEHGFEIQDNTGEYQKAFSMLDDSLYRLEKEMLDEAVKKTLKK